MTTFIHNAWYAVCWSHELVDKPQAKRVLGEDIAVYRTKSGLAAAVEDCCPHRFAPMSLGHVDGESIVCGYHGMEFDRAGCCKSIPGQKNVPSRVKIKTYPVVEKHNLIWAWTGASERADEALIPEVHWLDAPGWKPVTGTTRYECNWILLVDNLLDLTHTTFVHQSTIGTEDVANTPITTEFGNDRVYVVRDMKNTVPSNFYKRVGGFDGMIDRWQRIWLEPPSVVVIDAGGVPAGGSRKEEANDGYTGIDTRIVSMLLPVDERTVDQIWAFVRDTQPDDTELDSDIKKSLTVTFGEDADFLAGQQANMERFPNKQMLNNTADAGVVQTRRLIERWIEADTATAEAAE